VGGSLSLLGRVTLYAPRKRLNTFVLSNGAMNGTDQGGNKVPASTPGECLTGVPAPILPLFLSLSLPFARLFVRWMSFFSSLRGRDKAFTEGFGETNMVRVRLMRLLRILSKEAPGCCRRIMRKEKGRRVGGGVKVDIYPRERAAFTTGGTEVSLRLRPQGGLTQPSESYMHSFPPSDFHRCHSMGLRRGGGFHELSRRHGGTKWIQRRGTNNGTRVY